jgi:lipoate-protein ligase A
MKLLDITLPSPTENLALDEALLDAAEAGESGEVLRFWESQEMFVVVGYANKVAVEANTEECERDGIAIYRRCSGGGTVLQGRGCLNYSLILRITSDGPMQNITTANRFIMERNGAAVAEACGHKNKIEVCGHTDLAFDGRKFSGNAQRRRKHYLLFHGTFLLNFDLSLVEKYLRMPSKQPDYREGRKHEEFITNIGLTEESVKEAMRKTWKVNSSTGEVPRHRVTQLVVEKYSRAEWNRKF